MKTTAIAHSPKRLHERSDQPSTELVYLAKRAIEKYQVTSLITSLAPGWEEALAKAAIELKIPFSVAVPYPGRDSAMKREDMVIYYDLLSQADDVYRISDTYCETALYDCYCWCVDHSEQVLALWDYEFNSEIFKVIDYTLLYGKKVVNLWEDWSHLYTLRREKETVYSHRSSPGAQIFPGKPA